MKKILALILASVMLFAVCSCDSKVKLPLGSVITTAPAESGNDTTAADTTAADTTAADTTTEEVTEAPSVEEKVEFEFGTVKGNTYENKFLKLGCKLDSDWVFLSEEEIAAQNGIAESYLDEDVKDWIKSATVIYDMSASKKDNSANINLNLEKVDASVYDNIVVKDVTESTVPIIKSAYENMGYTDFTSEIIADDSDPDQAILAATAKLQGVDVYLMSLSVKVKGYLVSIAIVTVGENKTEEIFNCFYDMD